MDKKKETPVKKRTRLKIKHPNPLFEKWLEEWKADAKTKDSRLQYTFSNALTTLRKYPLPLQSGKECGILKHFGTGLCSMLDKKLAEYKKENTVHGDLQTVPPLQASPKPAKKAVAKKRPLIDVPLTSEKNDPVALKQCKITKTFSKTPESVTTCPSEVTNNRSSTVRLSPGTMQILLLVDNGETTKASKKPSKVAAFKELQTQKLPFEMRNLSVGDFMWIAKSGDAELVLPHIVERKRSDDLAQSIKDKRYYEQKMRLKATGLSVVYLVEALNNCRTSLPPETLLQAQAGTEVSDRFCVKSTSGVKDTVSYLATMTRVLEKKYQNKTLVSCSRDSEPVYSLKESTLHLYHFKEFNEGAAKVEHFTVREMFAQQLLQISGASIDAVCAIVEKFSTPSLLRKAFDASSETQRLDILTVITFGNLKKRVPQEVARRIWLFYTAQDFDNI